MFNSTIRTGSFTVRCRLGAVTKDDTSIRCNDRLSREQQFPMFPRVSVLVDIRPSMEGTPGLKPSKGHHE